MEEETFIRDISDVGSFTLNQVFLTRGAPI